MGGRSRVVQKSEGYLVQNEQGTNADAKDILTEMRCSPQSSQSSRSCAVLDVESDRASGRGRTLSVMMQIAESDSTTSMNLSTSGCRMLRSLRRELRARGMVDLLSGLVRSYSKTETRLPSSCLAS